MARYVKITGGVPAYYNKTMLKADNPSVSFRAVIPDALLAEYDVYPLIDDGPPAFDDAIEYVTEGPVTGSGELWTQTYVVTAFTAQELADQKQSKIDNVITFLPRQSYIDLLPILWRWQARKIETPTLTKAQFIAELEADMADIDQILAV